MAHEHSVPLAHAIHRPLHVDALAGPCNHPQGNHSDRRRVSKLHAMCAMYMLYLPSLSPFVIKPQHVASA